jgi:hypothetical protein
MTLFQFSSLEDMFYFQRHLDAGGNLTRKNGKIVPDTIIGEQFG